MQTSFGDRKGPLICLVTCTDWMMGCNPRIMKSRLCRPTLLSQVGGNIRLADLWDQNTMMLFRWKPGEGRGICMVCYQHIHIDAFFPFL